MLRSANDYTFGPSDRASQFFEKFTQPGVKEIEERQGETARGKWLIKVRAAFMEQEGISSVEEFLKRAEGQKFYKNFLAFQAQYPG